MLFMTTMTGLYSFVIHWHSRRDSAFWKKRFVDVALRYGTPPFITKRWKKTLEIKELFEEKIHCSIYELLPGVVKIVFNKQIK